METLGRRCYIMCTLCIVYGWTQLVSRCAYKQQIEIMSTCLHITRLGPRYTDGAGGGASFCVRIDDVSDPHLLNGREHYIAETPQVRPVGFTAPLHPI